MRFVVTTNAVKYKNPKLPLHLQLNFFSYEQRIAEARDWFYLRRFKRNWY